MIDRMYLSPSRYVQGRAVLSHLADYTTRFGDTCLVILTAGGARRLSDVLEKAQADAPSQRFVIETFSGECEMGEIQRLTDIAQREGAELVCGIGGGKTLDTAKAVAHYAELPVVVAPTAASSDAPCSALAVVYTPDGGLDQLLKLRRNPDVVLCDENVIAAAPQRLLAAGIGDALATYFESRQVWRTDSPNFTGTRVTLAAQAIAEKCYETLVADACQAYLAAGKGVCTKALANVIEANTLLSGIGFESAGTCGAHPINNGLSACPETAGRYHGELVAFSLLAQTVLFDEGEEQFWQIASLLHAVNLPITLAELGFDQGISEEELDLVARIANGDGDIHKGTKQVEEADVKAAVLAADLMGAAFLAEDGD